MNTWTQILINSAVVVALALGGATCRVTLQNEARIATVEQRSLELLLRIERMADGQDKMIAQLGEINRSLGQIEGKLASSITKR